MHARSWTCALVAIILLGTTDTTFAQPGRGGYGRGPGGRGPGGDGRSGGGMDFFINRMDRNQDGKIERDEISRLPGTFRETLEKNVRFPISREELSKEMPRIMERARERYQRDREERDRDRDRDDDRGRDEDRGRYDRGRGDYGRGDYGRDRRGSRYSTPQKKEPEKVRVTADLPEKYSEGDMNKDGQVALFEWRQWKPKEIPRFFALDANRDGILTPRELVIAEKFPPLDDALALLGDGPEEQESKSSESKKEAPEPSESKSTEEPNKLVVAEARYVFRQLDGNKDGKLTDDEWYKSRGARAGFKRQNINFKRPVDTEGFVAVYPAQRLFPSIPERDLK